MSPLRSSLIGVTIAGALLAPAAAQAASTTLSIELAPTRVAAWEGTVMWSRYDAAARRYTLVKSVDGGPPVAVGVPSRAGSPFDVDLGTNRAGSTYAVYTRDGDIYRLGVASGRERRIGELSSPDAAERDPTIQRGEIAFIRRYQGRDQLRIGNTTSGSRGSRLLVARRHILGVELGIGHVAYVEQVPSDWREVHVRVRNIRTGADRRVYRAASGGANVADVTRPTYVATPAGFVWARTNLGSGRGNRLVRYTLRGSRLDYAQGSPFHTSTAWAGARLGAATSGSLPGSGPGACADAGTNYCVVGLTGPPRFGLRP